MTSPQPPQRDPRIERLLNAPIVPTVLRLAAPGIVLVAFQSAVSITDAYFVGRLGTVPLAGLSLVVPLIMLLQMMSAGAMGGGVSSAIARSLGAGKEAAARSLVVHALVDRDFRKRFDARPQLIAGAERHRIGVEIAVGIGGR